MPDTEPTCGRLPEQNEISYEAALAWLNFEHSHSVNRNPISGPELERWCYLETPFFVRKSREMAYRKAYTQGFSDAIDAVRKLYCSLGFSRPKEIVAILSHHFDEKLMMWRRDFYTDIVARVKNPPPPLEQESWPSIRQRIRERDEDQCVVCGETQRLQVDHIVPVKRYGLPTDDNLQTLCWRHAQEKLENYD